MSLLSKSVLAGLSCVPALACTCVTAANDTRTPMSEASVVFRGTVIERKTLPQRPEMKGRGRYAITFRVDEYWKGSPGTTIVIYGVDPGTDCMGWGDLEVGKAYLMYAVEGEAKDVMLGDHFWIGWADLFPKGAKMLVPEACAPSGEVAQVQAALRELGKGKRPERRTP